MYLVAQSCLTLCKPMDYSPPVSSVLFSRPESWSGLPCPPPQGFPTQGSNSSLPQCRQILYHWSNMEDLNQGKLAPNYTKERELKMLTRGSLFRQGNTRCERGLQKKTVPGSPQLRSYWEAEITKTSSHLFFLPLKIRCPLLSSKMDLIYTYVSHLLGWYLSITKHTSGLYSNTLVYLASLYFRHTNLG